MSPIAAAASVLLTRGPGSREVFVVRRAEQLRFMGGFLAFPGGKAEPGDAALAGGPGPAAARRVTAARELFEEVGVLLARRADGSLPSSPAELTPLRRDLAADRLTFADVLGRLGASVRAGDLPEIGRLVTPDFAPVRFDTTFFVAQLPAGQEPDVWPGELTAGRWATAAGLLGEWTRGECLISPPTLLFLEALRDRPVAEAPVRFAPYLRAQESDAPPRIDLAPGVRMIPLRTRGLAPSTHTNAYLVGTGPAYLIDPGAADPGEQQRLFRLLDARQEQGQRLTAVLLTHQHPDHVGAAADCARRYRVPVWAHPETARALAGKVDVGREVRDGQRLDLGTAPDGTAPWFLEALHTPGHAAGHLAFYEPHYRLLFAGDLVSTLSSVVIAPPDGDLAAYLDSLRRLRGLDCRLLLPGRRRSWTSAWSTGRGASSSCWPPWTPCRAPPPTWPVCCTRAWPRNWFGWQGSRSWRDCASWSARARRSPSAPGRRPGGDSCPTRVARPESAPGERGA